MIHDIYFVGGLTSFAGRFGYLFPRHEGLNGVMIKEVPISMAALVATAVRSSFAFQNWYSNIDQLYAALYEWRSGIYQNMEFSANAYFDVYQGHIGTFNNVQEHRDSAFHVMMGDIYAQAR